MEILLNLNQISSHLEKNLEVRNEQNFEAYEKALDFAKTLNDEFSQNKCKINIGIANGEFLYQKFKNNFQF